MNVSRVANLIIRIPRCSASRIFIEGVNKLCLSDSLHVRLIFRIILIINDIDMKIRDFFTKFPDEASCKAHFKSEREKQGVVCKRCGHGKHYWLSTREQSQCKKCRFRTTLKSGTLLHGFQLPYHYWYFGMMMLTGTKKSFSAMEVQRQLGHRYYEPIWYMTCSIKYSLPWEKGTTAIRSAMK